MSTKTIKINPGRYATPHTQEWWDDLVSDTIRERAVAAALGLPVVEIVTDSDEEVDLASVWLVTDDYHARAIGHVTTEPDGTIVVEVIGHVTTEPDGTIVVEVLDDMETE